MPEKRLKSIITEPYKNPLSLFIITVILVFWAEYFVMLILALIEPSTLLLEAFLDALLLSVISVPILYFVLIVPFKALVREKEKLERDMEKLKSETSKYKG
jgi:cell shape-determining protein MreD